MKLNPQIFREYDIRGTVDTDLSVEFAYLLGRAYASLARENGKNNIGVGHDCRDSSPGGPTPSVEVSLTRELTLPLSAWAQRQCSTTRSMHVSLVAAFKLLAPIVPPDMNGFKLCLGTHTLSGEQIQDLFSAATS